MTLGPSGESNSAMPPDEPPKEEEESRKRAAEEEVLEPECSGVFFELATAEGRKAPVFEIANMDMMEPLFELRRHLKHVDGERSELLLNDYLIVSESTGFPGNAFTMSLSGDGNDEFSLMGKIYVDGHHNVQEMDDDGCVGYLRIPLGAPGVWWLDEPAIFFTYKSPDGTPGGDLSILLGEPHAAYAKRDIFHGEAALKKHIRITNCVLFDFVQMHPEATLEREIERTKAEEKEEDLKEEVKAEGDEATAATEDEEEKVGAEDYPSLDEMLVELGSSLEELRLDQDLHYFMRFQLGQGTVAADGSAEEGGSLSAEFLRLPLIQELLYPAGEDGDDEFFPAAKGKKKRKVSRRTPKTTTPRPAGSGPSSNYVALSGDLFITPVVEDSFAFHYPSLLGEKRYKELTDADRVANHRITIHEHGKADLLSAEVGPGVETGNETRFNSVRIPFPDGHSLALRPGLFLALRSRSAHPDLQGDVYVVKCCYMVRKTTDLTDGIKIHGPLFRIRGFELLGKGGREELEAKGIMSGEQMDELIYMGKCVDAGVEEVLDAVSVCVEPVLDASSTLSSWQSTGGEARPTRAELGGKFLCRLKYASEMRWVHLTEDEMEALGAEVGDRRRAGLCLPCSEKQEQDDLLQPSFGEGGTTARIGGINYRIGDFVLFDPTSDPLPTEKSDTAIKDYPEPYEENQMTLRQYKKNLKKWPEMSKFSGKPLPEPPEPFTVHRIESFDQKSRRVELRAFYRTSDIDHGGLLENRLQRLSREIYWSYELNSVTTKKGWTGWRGRAWVGSFEADKEADKWTAGGPNRLFCRRIVEFENGLPVFADLGEERKAALAEGAARASDFPKPPAGAPLTALELFCGGGGMARGMKDVGIQTAYANDMCRPAIATFKRNFPNAITHLSDINHLLKDTQEHQHCPPKPPGSSEVANDACFLAGKKDADGDWVLSRDKRKAVMETCGRVPRRGELDVICGGPPCQGFSKMNRFPKSGNSQRKNTGMTAMLASVDLLRPKWVVIENVANLAQHNSIIRAPLQDMGYQVQIYITNAMGYGVPESRRRNFIVCAGPGCGLPAAPTPLFASLYTPLHFPVMGEKDDNRGNGSNPALLYQMTSFEALGDLVKAPMESQETGKGFRCPLDEDAVIQLPAGPTTWWQRTMRSRQGLTSNNSTKKLTAQEVARVVQVPFPTKEIPHPNWRFIANEAVTLNHGGKTHTFEPLLPYYEDKSNVWYWRCEVCIRREKEGKKLMGKECNIQGDARRWGDKIIPSCLAHMGKKNSWTNCYGRVSYDAQFMTITCADGLTNKTGRLLHPELNRMYTVRELARGQGFPDSHVFAGLHYRVLVTQVGNAVPPPMAREIGRTIMDAWVASPKVHAVAAAKKELDDDMPELI